MAVVINFVIDNFIWFMVGAIIIILAIIGGYADKTNFGEGKKIIKVKKNKKDIIDSLEVKEKPDTEINTNAEENQNVENKQNVLEVPTQKEDNEKSNEANNSIDITENVEQAQNMGNTEDKNTENKEEKNDKETSVIDTIIKENKEANEELDSLLPEKDVLDDDLFQDLGSMEDIDFSSKKNNIKDIPDLDDVLLPDITKGKKNKKQIWKK